MLEFKPFYPSKKRSSISATATITFRLFCIILISKGFSLILSFYHVMKLLIKIFFQINGFYLKASHVKQELPHGKVLDQFVVMKYKLCLYPSHAY